MPPAAEHAEGHAHRHASPTPDTGTLRSPARWSPSAATPPASPATTPPSTDGRGHYTIPGIIPGTYPKVFARGPGYDPVVQTRVDRVAARTTLNWALRRDWAASSGGGSVADFTAPTSPPFGCGPDRPDRPVAGQRLGQRSSPTNPDAARDPQPKFVVIQLPNAVNITEMQINPSNTCGDARQRLDR